MIYEYKLTHAGIILRSDGAAIPPDEANTDYQQYLVWLSAGNIPTQADPLPNPRIAEIKAMLSTIDSKKIRPSSEIAVALAIGAEVSIETRDTLLALENEANQLRAELRVLLK